jgi:diguanylate cyclase (GGDEF)-like protein
MSMRTVPEDVRRMVDRDRLRMLYDQAPGSIVMSSVAALGLVLSAGPGAIAAGAVWWGAIYLFMMLIRALLAGGYVVKMRRGGGDADPEAVRRWSVAYRVLVLLAGVQFALWPLLFYTSMDPLHRLTSTVILGSMAGGSIAILSIERGVALAYGALIILPYSIMLVAIGTFGERVCGVLGLLYVFTMVFSIGRAHRSLMESLVLSHRNAALVQQLDGQSRELLETNQQLAMAQDDLRGTNQRLEARIVERTTELHRIATRDNLTGLANRSRLTELAAAHLREGERPASLYFIDLDGFKEINDTMGHAVGDTVLSEVATRLAVAAGEAFVIARWGGDEFVVLRETEHDPMQERRYAEQLLETLRHPVHIDPYTVRVDACVGIAHWPEDGHGLQELIYSADLAVYSAKAEGPGVIRVFDDSLAERGRRVLRLRQALARELAAGCPGFGLVYQPIFDASTGALAGVEALLRWRHALLGAISPAEFIPLAERSGDMITLGLWVLREACRFGAGFERAELPAMSVNVSVQQLLYPSFADDLASVLRDTDLEGDRLTLEITESVFITDFERIAAVFRKIEPMGVRIAIDDFGTGYSSLSYLQRLPAKLLKLDGSFVSALDSGGAPILEAGISLARAFGMRVIAEGVESQEQLVALLGMGVDAVQGYLLGMPQDGNELRSRYVNGRYPKPPRLAHSTQESSSNEAR